MSKFDELPDQHRELLAAYSRDQFRPRVLDAARALNNLAALIEMWGIGGMEEIAAQLDAGTVIVDNTGLAGAGPVTVEMMTGFINGAKGLLAVWNTTDQKKLYGQIAGPMNVVGH